MSTHNRTVQNGTTMDHDSDISMSDIEQGLGLIRLVETKDGLELKYHITARERLYNEYSKFAVKTAQSTVEMCRIVFEAKKALVKSEYDCFLKDVGRKSEDSTVRKFLAIGERYDDLIAATNLLPSSWTSIYEITQIPSDVFMAMVAMGESMAHLTGAQLKLLRGNDSSDKSSKPDTSPATPTMPSASVTAPVSASVSKEAELSVDAESDEKSDEYADAHNAANSSVSCASETVSDSTVTTDTRPDEPDQNFAASTAAPMLERVSQSASLNVEAAAEVEHSDEPYSVVIRFNRKPSDEAMCAIADSLTTLFRKHRIDAEISTTREKAI
jgi:hypothetical protein